MPSLRCNDVARAKKARDKACQLREDAHVLSMFLTELIAGLESGKVPDASLVSRIWVKAAALSADADDLKASV